MTDTGWLQVTVDADHAGSAPVDDTRVNVCERWATQADLDEFRSSGPDDGQASQILAFHISEFVVNGPPL